MKRILVVTICAGFLFVAACGGSSGGGDTPAATEAEAAFDDLAAQVETCLGGFLAAQEIAVEAGVEKQVVETCNCDGGGTITLTASADLTQLDANIDNCVTASGETYSGSFSSTDGGNTINGNLDPFGQCASGTATNVKIDGTCGGTIAATCDSGTVSCTVIDPASGGDECDLSC